MTYEIGSKAHFSYPEFKKEVNNPVLDMQTRQFLKDFYKNNNIVSIDFGIATDTARPYVKTHINAPSLPQELAYDIITTNNQARIVSQNNPLENNRLEKLQNFQWSTTPFKEQRPTFPKSILSPSYDGNTTFVSPNGKLKFTVKPYEGNTFTTQQVNQSVLERLAYKFNNEVLFETPKGEIIVVDKNRYIQLVGVPGKQFAVLDTQDSKNAPLIESIIKDAPYENLPHAIKQIVQKRKQQEFITYQASVAKAISTCNTILSKAKFTKKEAAQVSRIFSRYKNTAAGKDLIEKITNQNNYEKLVEVVTYHNQRIIRKIAEGTYTKDPLAFALELNALKPFIGSRIKTYTSDYSKFLDLANKAAVERTGTDIFSLYRLASDTKISTKLITKQYNDAVQLARHKELIGSLVFLRENAQDKKQVDDLVNLALIANDLNNAKADVLAELVKQVKDIQSSCNHEPNILPEWPKPFIPEAEDLGRTNKDLPDLRIPDTDIKHSPPLGGDVKDTPICPPQEVPTPDSICPKEEEKETEPWSCNHAKGVNNLPSFTEPQVASNNNGPSLDPEPIISIERKPIHVDDEWRVSKEITEEKDTPQSDDQTNENVPTVDRQSVEIDIQIKDKKYTIQVGIGKDGVYCDENTAKLLRELLNLKGLNGKLMDTKPLHLLGGTWKNGKFTGLHVNIPALVEEGYLEENKAKDLHDVYDVPEGYSCHDIRPAGEEFKNVEYKMSTCFPQDMPLEQIAEIINEAWENILSQEEKLIEESKNFTKPIRKIIGISKFGIKILFNEVNFKDSSIGSIYPFFDKKVKCKN